MNHIEIKFEIIDFNKDRHFNQTYDFDVLCDDKRRIDTIGSCGAKAFMEFILSLKNEGVYDEK